MNTKLLVIAVVCIVFVGVACALHKKPPASPNGIDMPDGYKNWKLIAPSYRSDNNTMRVILGNSAAVLAARRGKTKPWPEGAVLAKIVWKNKTHEKWPGAVVPGEFVHAEFMIKDSGKYASTGGWGFARWKGLKQVPYGKDENFVQECFGCHTPVKDNDYVFTVPAVMP